MDKKLIILLLITISICACSKRDNLTLPENLISSITRFDDIDGHFDINTIQGKKFLPQKNHEKIVINNNVKASWIIVKPSRQVSLNKNYVLELNRPTLDKVTAYIREETSEWRIIKTGDTLPFSRRNIPHENFLFNISGRVLKQFKIPIYIKIQNPVITFSSIKLWEETQFNDANARRSLLMGIFFGTLLSLIIYNFLIYLSIRDVSYLWYVAYLSFMLLYLLAISGYTFRFLWPDKPIWANHSTYFALLISMSMGLGFCRSMFHIPLISPILARLMKWVGVIIVLLAFLDLFFSYPFIANYMSYLGLLTIVLMLYAVITSIRSGYKPAYYAALGFLFLFAGSMTLILFKLEILPRNIISEYGIQIGVLFEAFTLSFALAYRIKYLNEKLKQSNLKLLEAEKLFSRKLIDFQDIERKETAATLHDSVGQKLLVIKIQLAQILKLFSIQQNNEKIKAIKGLVNEVINDIRDISHSLHPHQIERLTLKEALEDVIFQSFKDTNIIFTYDFSGIEECIDKKNSLHIYRIFQESINNIIKHSKATNVGFKSQRINDEQIKITIQDNGKGMTKQKWLKTDDFNKAYGLATIKERVNSLNGTVVFNSPYGHGFQIKILIPCNDRNFKHENQ